MTTDFRQFSKPTHLQASEGGSRLAILSNDVDCVAGGGCLLTSVWIFLQLLPILL